MWAEGSAPAVRQKTIIFEAIFERPAQDQARTKLVRNFFQEALAQLGRGMPEAIFAGPPLERAWPDGSGWAGPPRSMWGHTVVQAHIDGVDRQSSSKFSKSALRRLTTRLGESTTTEAELLVCRLDHRGNPFMGERPHLGIYYERVLQDWIRLSAAFDTVDLFDPDFTIRFQRFQRYALAGFIRRSPYSTISGDVLSSKRT